MLPVSQVSANTEHLDYDACIRHWVEVVGPETPIESVRSECSKYQVENPPKNNSVFTSPLDRRKFIDKSNQFKPFTLQAFKPNYILPYVYNSHGYDADIYREQFQNDSIDLDKSEAHFQLSVKVPIAVGLFNRNVGLFAAYTNRSFWQVYNTDLSSPFRETNHEPEVWLQASNNINLWGLKNSANMLGVSHQSNGTGGILSRSWNRVYGLSILEKEKWVFGIKAWARVPEKRSNDDNPDITDYLGHGELRVVYKSNEHLLSLMTRNNLESRFSRGAVELGWSFPISNRKDIKGYVQLFTGYGESLIDYNNSVERVGFGVLLSDWL